MYLRSRNLTILLSLLLLIIACEQALAQTTESNASSTELLTRIRQLEERMQTMNEELTRLKQTAATAGTAHNSNSASSALATSNSSPPTSIPSSQEKKPPSPATPASPAGIELGPVRVIPYGTIYFNAFGNSGNTNNADVPLFAAPGGSGSLSASGRQTRLGFRFEGPKTLDAKLSGVVEADFFGGFPSVGIGENFGVVRLRLANAKLDWEQTSLTVGQDWMVFAPVSPVSIASAGIPQLAAAGNPWARLPQVRLERRSAKGTLSVQGAILAPSSGDYPSAGATPFVLQPGSGAASRTPYLQSRVAFNQKDWLGLKKPGSIGASIHYGRSRVAAATDVESFGAALDWNIPLVPHFSLAGEAFFGRNLAGFQSGVFQNYNPEFAYRSDARLVRGGARAIGTRGGWVQLGFSPDDAGRLTFYGSYGADDPRNEDLVSVTRRDWRTKNQAFGLNMIYKLSRQVSVSAEYRRLETDYIVSGKQHNNHGNLGLALSF